MSKSLPSDLIAIFSPHFPDLDLARVRIYLAIPALLRRVARISPIAITVGDRIYFERAGTGGYDPASITGLELIAHELTHVRQFFAFKTRAGFGLRYLLEYRKHRATGMLPHEAYSHISYEIEAVNYAAKVIAEITKASPSGNS